MQATPMVDGNPNSVELELATLLHGFETEELLEESAGDLRVWLGEILWSGKKGYSQMRREELLSRLQADFIDHGVESFDTVEDALE